jgi:hypothetical protein
LNHKEVRGLLSDEHFSVDGTQVAAWASMKSFRAKDGSDEPPSTSSQLDLVPSVAVGACRSVDPARQARWQQAPCRSARSAGAVSRAVKTIVIDEKAIGRNDDRRCALWADGGSTGPAPTVWRPRTCAELRRRLKPAVDHRYGASWEIRS